MKTIVLGYSKTGVYVEVENTYASMIVDLNTTTGECIESYDYSVEDCDYELSSSEHESVINYAKEVL